MADIELVIKISEEEYEDIINSEDCGLHRLTRAIAKGTPLPKGHGRLIDDDRISLIGIHFKTERDHATMIGRLNSALTIIEAHKTESEEVGL